MKNMNEFDVSISKSDIKFLPFRNFLPLRNEALAMMTSIVWNKVLITINKRKNLQKSTRKCLLDIADMIIFEKN
jgi:hypothetical protein